MNNEKIGEFIAQLRKSQNLTQRELAEKLNVTDKAVSKWERGVSLPDITILPDLSEMLCVTITELLNGEKEDKEDNSDNSKGTVLAAIQYADGEVKNKTKNVKIICSVSITCVFIIGIMVCSICDWAINNSFTWSLFPISSIIYTWLLVMPVTLWGKKGIIASIAMISIFTVPFLSVLNRLIKISDLIMPIGFRVTLISVIYIWAVYILLYIFKNRKYIAVSLSVIFSIPLCLIINLIVRKYIGGKIIDQWDIMLYSILIISAIIIYGINYMKNKNQN